jgi:hypothetical protein
MNVTRIVRTAPLRVGSTSGILRLMKSSPRRHSPTTQPSNEHGAQQLTLREEIKLAETKAREETTRILARFRIKRLP